MCDPASGRCAPPEEVTPGDFCCQCPVSSPPFPHAQVCFDGINGQETNCEANGCFAIPGLTCGTISEICGGSPSGAFLDPADPGF